MIRTSDEEIAQLAREIARLQQDEHAATAMTIAMLVKAVVDVAPEVAPRLEALVRGLPPEVQNRLAPKTALETLQYKPKMPDSAQREAHLRLVIENEDPDHQD